jgi:hypothetical protein
MALMALGVLPASSGVDTPPYAPAYYTGVYGEPRSSQIMVFPPTAKEFSISLPYLLRALTFAPDAEALYAVVQSATTPTGPRGLPMLEPPRLIKVEFSPLKISTLPSVSGVDTIFGLAVAQKQDKVLFPAAYPGRGASCDLLELSLPDGNLAPVVRNSGCALDLSFSPGGDKAIVPHRGGGTEAINLASGSVTPLAGGFWKAAFSPDGRWIAALWLGQPSGRHHTRLSETMLIDVKDLTRQRNMGGKSDVEVIWSPDSRYLLYSESQRGCPEDGGVTLFKMDIETGKRSVVQGSECKVTGNRKIGWVSLAAADSHDTQ